MTSRLRARAAAGIAFVAAVAALAAPAAARPYKIDFNANICEEMSGAVARRSDGVKALNSGGAYLLCPLDLVTLPTDATGGTANVSFKAYYTGPTGIYCDLNAYWSVLGWTYWAGPSSNTGGIIQSTPASWSLPGAGSESPFGIYVYCSLPQNTILGLIQLTTN